MWLGDGEGSQKSVGLNVETPKNDKKQQYFYKLYHPPFLQRSSDIKTDYTGYLITRMQAIGIGSLSIVSTKSERQFHSFFCLFTVKRRHSVSFCSRM